MNWRFPLGGSPLAQKTAKCCLQSVIIHISGRGNLHGRLLPRNAVVGSYRYYAISGNFREEDLASYPGKQRVGRDSANCGGRFLISRAAAPEAASVTSTWMGDLLRRDQSLRFYFGDFPRRHSAGSFGGLKSLVLKSRHGSLGRAIASTSATVNRGPWK